VSDRAEAYKIPSAFKEKITSISSPPAGAAGTKMLK